MCSWKLFSLHVEKQKLKAEQSAGKRGESTVFVCACLCVKERDTQRRQDICEVMPHEAFSVRLALFWKVEGGRGGGLAGGRDKQTAGPGLKDKQ